VEQASQLVSVLIGSRDRPSSLIHCLSSIITQTYVNIEIIVLDDNSEEIFYGKIKQEFDDPRIRCIRSNSTLGVAAGRNRLAKEAKGDYLIVLDDDARFRYKDSIEKVVNLFNIHDDVGLLAFKIVDIIDNEERGMRIPFPRNAIRKNPEILNESQLVSYYLGGGHSMKKEVFDICGLYPDNLFFGGEELDLSYRILENGYKLFYVPDIVVDHFPDYTEVLSRATSSKYLYFTIRNKIWINYKYLPWFPFIVNSAIWIFILLASSITKGSFLELVKGIKDGITGIRKLNRTPLSNSTVAYLKRNYGRLFR